MANEILNDLIDGLVSRADQINNLYISAAGISIIVATLKFQGVKKEFEFKGIAFKLSQYWIITIAFTLAHLYLAFLFVNSCQRISTLNTIDKKTVLTKLTYSKAPFIFQDLKIAKHSSEAFKYNIDLQNPPIIILLSILLLFVITVFKIEKSTIREKIGYWVIAYILLVLNYYIGGWWMIELSKSLSQINYR